MLHHVYSATGPAQSAVASPPRFVISIKVNFAKACAEKAEVQKSYQDRFNRNCKKQTIAGFNDIVINEGLVYLSSASLTT